MKKSTAKLALKKQTVSVLSQGEMKNLKGGELIYVGTILKPDPTPWIIFKPDPTPWVIVDTIPQITIM